MKRKHKKPIKAKLSEKQIAILEEEAQKVNRKMAKGNAVLAMIPKGTRAQVIKKMNEEDPQVGRIVSDDRIMSFIFGDVFEKLLGPDVSITVEKTYTKK